MWILKITSHLAYVARLPCETLMSAKQDINDKLQGSVATYLRYGVVVNNHIKKGSTSGKKLKSVNIWQSYKQERGSHALCAPGQHIAKRLRFGLSRV